jgi:hypothetical protein
MNLIFPFTKKNVKEQRFKLVNQKLILIFVLTKTKKMPTITNENIKIEKTYTIEYENGIKCAVVEINDILTYYTFLKENKRYRILNDSDIEFIKNNHWSKHHEIESITITKEELLNFKNFQSLYYIGAGIDGLTHDINGNYVESIIFLSDIDSQIYLDIETSEKHCKNILNNANKEFIVNSNIKYIPYYNQEENKDEHYTISLSAKLPNDLYTKYIESEKSPRFLAEILNLVV